MFASLTLASAFILSPSKVLISGSTPTDGQRSALPRAVELTEKEMEELNLFRLESDKVVVLVTSDAFPLREYGELNTSLQSLAREPAKKGLFFFSADAGGVLTKMIGVGEREQLAIMPRIRLVIEVDGMREVVSTERADIHESFPEVPLSSGKPATPRVPWPRLPVSIAEELKLHWSGKPDEKASVGETYAFAIQMLADEVEKTLNIFENSYRALFLSARQSDPDHFGEREIVPGRMDSLTESMLDVLAMRVANEPDFKGMDRASVKAKLKEGKIVRVVHGLFTVQQSVTEKGRSATLRELPIPEPPAKN